MQKLTPITPYERRASPGILGSQLRAPQTPEYNSSVMVRGVSLKKSLLTRSKQTLLLIKMNQVIDFSQ